MLPRYSAEYTDGKTLIYQDSFVIIYYILAEDATPLDLSRASKSSEMSPPLLISRVGKTVRDKKKMKQRRPRIGSKLNVKPSPSQDRPCRERRKRTVPKWAKANELLLDLLCPICNELMVDATVTPCCGNSFCNGCVRSLLLKSGDGTCFDCNKSISPDDLVPYPALRWIIMNWRNILWCTCECRRVTFVHVLFCPCVAIGPTGLCCLVLFWSQFIVLSQLFETVVV